MNLLSRWWCGDIDERTAEAQARVDASLDGAFVGVAGDLLPRIRLQPPAESEFQKITRETDIKAITKAIVFGESRLRSGMVHMWANGVRCERCGQEGQLYRHKDLRKMLVCSHVHRGIFELFDRLERERWKECERTGYVRPPDFVGGTVIRGYSISAVPCGVNIVLHLRMRHCWFD